MMTKEKLITETALITRRSAFSSYIEEGIDYVKKYFPECVEFVIANKERSLEDVTKEIMRELSQL